MIQQCLAEVKKCFLFFMLFINQLNEGGEVHQEPRIVHYGIQRQFSLQSPPCALNSGNHSLNQQAARAHHSRTPAIGTEHLSRTPKKQGRVQHQHLNKQQSSDKSPNLPSWSAPPFENHTQHTLVRIFVRIWCITAELWNTNTYFYDVAQMALVNLFIKCI